MDRKALDCIRDTLFMLLDEAKTARSAVLDRKGNEDKRFAVYRGETLVEILHTWANQVKTFELDVELGEAYVELRKFLDEAGMP